MATKKNTTPAPVQALLIIDTPQPVTVSAPDVTALITEYTEVILPMNSYRITTPEEFVLANRHWSAAKDYVDRVEILLSSAKKTAHAAHKAITTLETQMTAPGRQIADYMHKEILRWNAEQEAIVRENERQMRLADEARRREEQREQQEAQDAERQRAIAERQAALNDIPEWERDEETTAALPVVPASVIVPLAPPVPIRLPSAVPQVIGGPQIVDKPWSGHVTDPAAFLRWILESPEDRISTFIEFRIPALNTKAKEFGADLGRVIPGTEGRREQTLKRA